MVNVCGLPTTWVALAGVTMMLASTKVLVAGPLPPGPELPLVERLIVTPPMVTWALALAVNLPAELLLMVSVQVAWLPTTVGLPQVEDRVPGAGETLVVMLKALAVRPEPPARAFTVML